MERVLKRFGLAFLPRRVFAQGISGAGDQKWKRRRHDGDSRGERYMTDPKRDAAEEIN